MGVNFTQRLFHTQSLLLSLSFHQFLISLCFVHPVFNITPDFFYMLSCQSKLPVKRYEIITGIITSFCIRHKNRRKHNQYSKLVFFNINLHFGTSDEISTFGKLNCLPISSNYLVFSSLEMQRRLIQTKMSRSKIQVLLFEHS